VELIEWGYLFGSGKKKGCHTRQKFMRQGRRDQIKAWAGGI